MIRIDEKEADWLVWLVNRFWEGDMGMGSASANRWIRRRVRHYVRTTDESGKVWYVPHDIEELEYEPARTTGSVQQREPSSLALRAAGKLREMRQQWSVCTPDQQFILDRAFKVGDCRGLMSLGLYPRASLGCKVTYRIFKERGHTDLAHLESWLRETVHNAAHGKRGDRRQAQQDIEAIREATETELREALVTFGVHVEGVVLPKSVTLRELARRLGQDHHTVQRSIERRSVRRFCRRDGYRVNVADLKQKWPEAARSLEAS